jgi:hypothetical protein
LENLVQHFLFKVKSYGVLAATPGLVLHNKDRLETSEIIHLSSSVLASPAGELKVWNAGFMKDHTGILGYEKTTLHECSILTSLQQT